MNTKADRILAQNEIESQIEKLQEEQEQAKSIEK